jgi:predicted phosphodiesterase
MTIRIAVLSDLHGAAEHARDALAAALAEGFDQLVILGDLLTYGPQPAEVLELAREATERHGALLIEGNHDQLYLELAGGSSDYFARLPDWIRDSVDYTLRQVGDVRALAELPWQHEWRSGPLLLAHANPFGPGDWTYLRDEPSFERACDVLADRGFRWGVFGHTHRFQRHRSTAHHGVEAVTVGSLGQPRQRPQPVSQWAMLTLDGDALTVEQRIVPRGWDSLLAAIAASPLPDSTKQRLCSFYQ